MSKAPRAALSEAHLHQISVLKTMSSLNPDLRPYEIAELAELTGLEDEREIQRYLYILEGQKLVTPYPEGDFTSRTWLITKHGMDAVRNFVRLGA